MNERLREPIAQVLSLLVKKEYEQLSRLTHGKRLSSQEMAQVVANYGRTLVEPPDDVFNFSDAVQVRGAEPTRWSISIPVWTVEEGRSDLSIELTVIDHGNRFDIELDDIHVL